VQRDARALIDALAALPRSRRPASVHVSGCEKGCACPYPTEISLVGSAPDRYDVYGDEPGAGSRFGVRRAESQAPREALRTALGAEARP
jgi:sulfite reductase beta subunit-like hemoprotein